jgi:hypothetical protein
LNELNCLFGQQRHRAVDRLSSSVIEQPVASRQGHCRQPHCASRRFPPHPYLFLLVAPGMQSRQKEIF